MFKLGKSRELHGQLEAKLLKYDELKNLVDKSLRDAATKINSLVLHQKHNQDAIKGLKLSLEEEDNRATHHY